MSSPLRRFLCSLSRWTSRYCDEPEPTGPQIEATNPASRAWEEIFNQQQYQLIPELFAADHRMYDPVYNGEEALEGHEALEEKLRLFHEHLPGSRVVQEKQLQAPGERVVTYLSLHVPQEEGEATFYGLSISQLSQEVLQETWLYWQSEEAAIALQPGGPRFWWWPPWSWR
ncbi:MAG: nuclear transport factor 2 family protein [Candidatus Promineifilaceae bacterium]|nr:nuclear transport factor 2 family protein [Candidatus Promineifilaceae bacterium]